MRIHLTTRLAGALLVLAAPLHAQGSLAARIDAVANGELQFEFEGREDVCGNGRSYIRVGESSYNGEWSEGERDACLPGPVRIVLRKEQREIVSLRAYVGPVSTVPGRA